MERNIQRIFIIGLGGFQKFNYNTQDLTIYFSSCGPYPDKCDNTIAMFNKNPNPYTLYGALVGGPNKQGKFHDERKDFKQTETACDYNAGFQSAVAGQVYSH